ncbi:hypothetical protein [Methylobacterium durans]|uniref:hypothetical protein n=1 Tax=Methylobacterium durans TaxID=2202825 RepID=UPI0013A55AD1|nr:hypothetical protein [Methylobacterium durans]
MKFLHWLMLRWRADRLRTLALRAFARGRALEQKADACDARAEEISPKQERSR